MKSAFRPSLVLTMVAVAALLALPAAASAYSKPPGGKWTIENLFEYTDGGAMTLSKDGGTLTKLVLTPGERASESCGSRPVRLVSNPKLKSFKKASGRWAIGRQPRSLIVPIGVRLKVDGGERRGKLVVLFDETGKIATTAKLTFGDCVLNFIARKRR